MTDCPCGSGLAYADCCEPYITGAKPAPTPEALMRARYSAYAVKNIDYLTNTLAPHSRKGFDPASAMRWAEAAEWKGLTVHEASENGDEGVVEFTAHFSIQGVDQEHHERSTFHRIDGVWYFIDGQVRGATPVVREAPKIGRNDPCPCGSGKKYKKCCGA